jgi:hypothetical protein
LKATSINRVIGAVDNSRIVEEPCERESLTHGFEREVRFVFAEIAIKLIKQGFQEITLLG